MLLPPSVGTPGPRGSRACSTRRRAPHVFHTDDEQVAAFVHRFGMGRPYRFEVLARIHPSDDGDPVVVSWPPQVDELRRLGGWSTVERELEARPPVPHGDDFETYAISVMGPTLYR